MKWLITSYEPIIWLLFVFGMIVGIPFLKMVYKISSNEKVDEWMLLCLQLSVSLLVMCWYFPYDIFWMIFFMNILFPFGLVQGKRYEYRMERKRKLGNFKEEHITESQMDKYLSNEEVKKIRIESIKMVYVDVKKICICFIFSFNIVYINLHNYLRRENKMNEVYSYKCFQ